MLPFECVYRRFLAKTAICIAAGSALLFAGYAAGLFVQHQREVRFRAYCQLYQLIPHHKELSLGDYDRGYELQCVEREIGSSLRTTHFAASWEDLPMLLRGGASASDEWDTDWRDKAVASAAGFHRDRPDIALPLDVKLELENFVPRDQDVRNCLNFYAVHRSPH